MGSVNEEYHSSREEVQRLMENEGYGLFGNILTTEALGALTISHGTLPWKEDWIPDVHRYEEADVPKAYQTVLEEIKEYFSTVLDRKLRVTDPRLRRFKKGSYVLQHDEQPADGMNVTLFLTSGWPSPFRGEFTYVPEEGEPLVILPEHNALLVVDKHSTTKFFVRRATHYAGSESYVALSAVLK